MTAAQSDGDGKFRALTTLAQLEALACRANSPTLAVEVLELLRTRPVQRASSCDESAVASWLINAWSTEYLISLSKRQLRGDALQHSLHWLFPQAYYAAFACMMSAFVARGYSERKHTPAIRKFGNEVLAGRVPQSLAFVATGGKQCTYVGLAGHKLSNSIQFDPAVPELVDAQIATFLKSTRTYDLVERRRTMPVPAKTGREKKSLNASDWQRVGSSLGPTSILSLLYRKRIKANYRDIDTFLHPDLDPARVHAAAGAVVSALNFFHEAVVESALGAPFFDATIVRLPENLRKAAQRRTDFRRALAP